MWQMIHQEKSESYSKDYFYFMRTKGMFSISNQMIYI
jgi:hypothetical protein